MHLKKKFLTANHVPYMTKSLREAIIRRAELESILKIGPLKINLNIKHKRIIAKDFPKMNEKLFT